MVSVILVSMWEIRKLLVLQPRAAVLVGASFGKFRREMIIAYVARDRASTTEKRGPVRLWAPVRTVMRGLVRLWAPVRTARRVS